MLKYYAWKLRKSLKLKPQKSLVSKQVNEVVEQESTKIVNLVGYAIVGLTLLDYLTLLIEPKFFNPIWGWETVGKLVETVWAPLLGFLLIFYRRNRDVIKAKELPLLSLLSWFALILGVIYFLISPILIGNAFRINRTQQAQSLAQIEQQKTEVQQYTQQLNRASNTQLNNLLQRYYPKAPQISSASSQEFKENLLKRIQQRQATVQKQLQTNFAREKRNLIKTTLKWLLGAIISGTAFVLIWSHTQWARVL